MQLMNMSGASPCQARTLGGAPGTEDSIRGMPRAEPEASAPPASALLAASGETERARGAAEVTAWLAAQGLGRYADALIAGGYQEVVLFRGMTEAEEEYLIAEHKV